MKRPFKLLYVECLYSHFLSFQQIFGLLLFSSFCFLQLVSGFVGLPGLLMGLAGLGLALSPLWLWLLFSSRASCCCWLRPLYGLGFLIAMVMRQLATNTVAPLEKSRVTSVHCHQLWAKHWHRVKHKCNTVSSRIVVFAVNSLAFSVVLHDSHCKTMASYCWQWSSDQVSCHVSVYRLDFSSFPGSTLCLHVCSCGKRHCCNIVLP